MNEMDVKISRGEVFYIASMYNTVGSEQRAGRPAVVVSNNINNEHSECVEICYLTLQTKTPLPTHVFVDRGKCSNSTILCEQVTTVSKERVGDYMCTLPDGIMDKVDQALVISLDLGYMIDKKSKTSSTAQEVFPDAERESMKTELESLREQVKAYRCEQAELIKARDSLMKKVEGAENSKQEAKLYKKMYENLLDKVLGK